MAMKPLDWLCLFGYLCMYSLAIWLQVRRLTRPLPKTDDLFVRLIGVGPVSMGVARYYSGAIGLLLLVVGISMEIAIAVRDRKLRKRAAA